MFKMEIALDTQKIESEDYMTLLKSQNSSIRCGSRYHKAFNFDLIITVLEWYYTDHEH